MGTDKFAWDTNVTIKKGTVKFARDTNEKWNERTAKFAPDIYIRSNKRAAKFAPDVKVKMKWKNTFAQNKNKTIKIGEQLNLCRMQT